MGGNKQKQTQQQTGTTNTQFTHNNAFDYLTPPDTADIQALRGFQFSDDPRVPYNFAATRRRIADTYDNPLGAAVSPALRDAQLRASYEDIGQQEAQALSESRFDRQKAQFAQLAQLAGLTRPELVQTSQSGTQSGTSSASGTSTIQQSVNPLNALAQGGSAIGSALIM